MSIDLKTTHYPELLSMNSRLSQMESLLTLQSEQNNAIL